MLIFWSVSQMRTFLLLVTKGLSFLSVVEHVVSHAARFCLVTQSSFFVILFMVIFQRLALHPVKCSKCTGIAVVFYNYKYSLLLLLLST